MDILERIWEFLTAFSSGVLRAFERGVTSIWGSANARYIRRMQGRVEAINLLESKYQAMDDAQLLQQTDLFRQRIKAGETLDDILVEAFAVCREAGRRFLSMRHYDVQLIGGMVLHSGAVAEMVTGEGKTLVATLPAYLNALTGKGVHVVTVNDYLARRDMEWMGPLYMGLGLTVGAIQSDMRPGERQKAYLCDITYGTNNEFGFDYLRDNMRRAVRGDHRFPPHQQQCQGKLYYAIVDEIDNILIDEARTPLIISGPAHPDVGRYAEADRIARQLQKSVHFTVNEKDHTANLTDEGVRQAERLAGVESFYTAGNMAWPHLIDNALKAHHLYKLDVNYVIKDGAIIIVDEFTGRMMEGRQWSDGLHQAVEAKEGVKIKEETQTLATITLQNYFKLYEKICGMTGTAMTEATEFWKIYKLDVIGIPTNRSLQRREFPDTIYNGEKAKWKAVADEIERVHRWDSVVTKNHEMHVGNLKRESEQEIVLADEEDGSEVTLSRSEVTWVQKRGRPILVGTVSIEKSELLSNYLTRRGIKHEVLNAKHHKREAEIIAQAGRRGAVTIATNMAGRGTDIVLGGNPETMAWAVLQDKYETRLDVPRAEWDQLVAEIDQRESMKAEGERVKQLGGLHVIGTERHDARRIDLQLRGRCGRQGDPGSSHFFLSLDDDLMRIFAGPFVKKMLEVGGFKDDIPIESRMVSRRIDSAQKKREEFNFEIRKSLLEYDEVMDEQRKRVYSFRQRILEGENCREIIADMIHKEVNTHLPVFLAANFGSDAFTSYASSQLATQLTNRSFRDSPLQEVADQLIDEAERRAETEILGAIDENLPNTEDDQTDWNWQALANFVNSRWKLNFRDRDLIKIGRDRVDEFLIEKARESIRKVDLSPAEPMLSPDYGLQTAARWLVAKFGVAFDAGELRGEVPAVVEKVEQRVLAKYKDKEAEFPVLAGFYKFTVGAGAQSRIDRDALLEWASRRFGVQLEPDAFKSKQRDELRQMLVQHSREYQHVAEAQVKAVQQQVEQLASAGKIPLSAGNGAGQSLADWFQTHIQCELDTEGLAQLDKKGLSQKLESLVEDRYHPEMRRMERYVLLEIVDSAWKEHLLAMDYLLAACRQRGMAALDPKVEYKREGMRMFGALWQSIGERVTDVVFRIEQLNEDFVSTTWQETAAIHESAPQAPAPRERDGDEEFPTGGGERKIETIRNRGPRPGRNDPCVCGSGKKYKNCCMSKLES
jgi:preprotein translocase subunit SecA